MRTTLRLDDDVYRAARSLAAQEAPFPTFELPANAAPVTPEMVRQALDEE